MDFQNVAQWKNNKLDRTKSSRMGWSDLSVSLRGQVVEDLRTHFVERWNFIYNEKYDVRTDARYSRLTLQQGYASTSLPSNPQYPVSAQGSGQPGYTPGLYFPPPPKAQGDVPSTGGHHYMRALEREATSNIKGHLENYGISTGPTAHAQSDGGAGINCQIVRSCTKWSHGVPTEHSIANAYIDVIHDSSYFLYIENQFFITATSDQQKPVLNQIGAAIVERVVRAARAGQKFKVIVLIPAIPGFAGDLKDESSLGTRAIMQYQYNAINRGGHSIMERIAAAGFDPTQYIRFYNLRNYDRLNVSASMREAEQASGINYEQARQEHDLAVDPIGYAAQQGPATSGTAEARQFQQAAQNLDPRKGLGTSRWDSVAECYMLGGLDIRKVPWEKGNVNEIDAFVCEELYIHTKIMIADDRVVICGSANLNDRSQLGYHDSEIAVVIEDTAHPIDSFMNGQPWKAAKFATTLRRQLFRKHLGLIPPQDMERPDPNFLPVGVPNTYDFGSAEDQLVADPLSDRFLNFWNAQAKTNTVAFSRIFHPVPDDSVRNWKDYNNFYEVFFKKADQEAEGKEGNLMPALYQWGHVVSRNFSPGDQGVREVKDLLSTVKGTLVEMPLQFLIEERDIAKQGLSLNAFTEEIYT
jgi:phospholipase D1/2